ncbi:hypothetical protein GS540_28950, partial [Rhodococcus hoagii]|nr:hypothetical protein [Prescottella equi]
RKANEWLGSAVARRSAPARTGADVPLLRPRRDLLDPGDRARAIPAELVDKFAGMGWETGALGYPVNDRTVLSGPDGKPWGVVQASRAATSTAGSTSRRRTGPTA